MTPTEPEGRPTPRAYSAATLAGWLIDDVAARQKAKAEGRPLGPVSGFKRLDTLLAGSFAPGIHVLHGAPGVGKTAFALGLALECQCPALFVSCELSPLELLRRLVARVTGLYLGRLKNGDPDVTADDLRARLKATAHAARWLTILDATAAPATLADLAAAVQVARSVPGAEEAPGAGHLLIVLDSIHTWANALPDEEGEEYDRLTRSLDTLDRFARTVGAPLVGIAERNRASRGGGQAASAGTRRFEYAAESMMELDADGKPSDADGWKAVRLTISKNRHGETTTLPLRWNGGLQRHEEGS